MTINNFEHSKYCDVNYKLIYITTVTNSCDIYRKHSCVQCVRILSKKNTVDRKNTFLCHEVFFMLLYLKWPLGTIWGNFATIGVVLLAILASFCKHTLWLTAYCLDGFNQLPRMNASECSMVVRGRLHRLVATVTPHEISHLQCVIVVSVNNGLKESTLGNVQNHFRNPRHFFS